MHIFIRFTMWPFSKAKEPAPTPKAPESVKENWKKDMLLRWTDLEARVTALELVDKTYKKQVRTKISADTGDQPSDLYNGMLVRE